MSPATVQMVEESYRRCQSEAFFQAFYRRLLDSLDERERVKFAKTNFSLVATVKELDPKTSPELEEAWRTSVAPGIEFMSGWYTRDATDAGG